MPSYASTLTGPIQTGYAITPSDTLDVSITTRGLYVGVAGDVKVTLAANATGSSVVLKGLASGIIHPIGVRRIYATGTTATDIVGLY